MNLELYSKEFLKALIEHQHRTVYIELKAYDAATKETLDTIFGVATGGSINIDGASAIRRSCNLTLTTADCHLNEYAWVLNTLFSISIGLSNTLKSQYPEYVNEDIIWFNQGHYVITSFNASLGTNQYNISISGQDKMCLLNGEVGGTIMMETDFGKYDQLDENGDIIETKVLTIREILENIIFEYTREKCEENQIELPEDSGLNLIEYRGDTPLYMLMEEKIEDDKISWETINMTIFGDQLDDNNQRIDSLTSYLMPPSLVDEDAEWIEGTTFVLNGTNYQVLKIEYGETAGYEKTELTYAGDLVAGVGENVTAVLDKIKNMLGEYEYFYDLDGKFRFQKKRTYLKTLWNDGKDKSENDEAEEEIEEYFYQFDDMKLFTSFANTPNLKNLKNDFSVWGSKKSATGNELPIHMRLAIDNKPLLYTSPYQVEEEVVPPAEEEETIPPIEGANDDVMSATDEVVEETSTLVYKVYDSSVIDWRELIYQMARDYSQHNSEEDFYKKLQEQNAWIEEGGRTYYEQYYTDLEGFWRQIYNPSDPVVYSSIYYNNINADNVYYTHPWVLVKDFTGGEYDKKELYIRRNSNGQNYYCSWIDSFDLKEGIDIANEVRSDIQIYVKTRDAIPESDKYYYKTAEGKMSGPTQPSVFVEDIIYYEQVTDKITVDSVYTKTTEGEYELLLSGNYITNYNRYYVLSNDEEYLSLEQSKDWIEQDTDNIVEDVVYKNINGNSAFIYENYVSLDPFSTWKTWESIEAESVLPQLYIYRARNKDYYAVNTYYYTSRTSDFSDGWSSEDYYDVRDGYSNLNIPFKCRVGAVNVDDGYELKSGDKLYIKRRKYNNQDGYVPYINYYSDRIPLVQYLNYYGVITNRDSDGNPTEKKKLSEKDLYIAQTNSDGSIKYTHLLDLIKIHKDELYVEITEQESDDSNYGPAHFELLSNIVKVDENSCLIRDMNQYEKKEAPFNQFEDYGQITWDGKLDSSLIISRPIQYYEPIHNYNAETGWHKNVDSNPESLLFWFDFLDPVEKEYRELEAYSVRAATRRPMAKNESSVKAIYYPPTPRVYFTTDALNIPEEYRNLFVISSQGVDAKETIDNWLYNHTYITESVTINSIPIYHLEPNTKIKIEDDENGIDGDYIVDKLTIPLTYNGTMTINATKAPSGFGAEN